MFTPVQIDMETAQKPSSCDGQVQYAAGSLVQRARESWDAQEISDLRHSEHVGTMVITNPTRWACTAGFPFDKSKYMSGETRPQKCRRTPALDAQAEAAGAPL